MKQRNVSLIDKALIAGLAALISFLTYLTAETLLKKDYEALLHRQIDEGFTQIDRIASEFFTNLTQLNALDIQKCDAGALLKMRQIVFLSTYIKGIGFLEDDQLVCTTSLGQLDTPFQHPPPDYTSSRDAKIWLDMPLVLTDKFNALVVQIGRFNAVAHRDFLNTLIRVDTQWQLSFSKHARHRIPLAGPLSTASVEELERWQTQSEFFLDECSLKTPYCITVLASEDNFHAHYKLALLGWKIITLLVFGLLCLLGARVMRRYRSIQSRVLRGLQRNAFYCLYQPIVEIQSGQIIGCEVLARYRDAKGELYPDEFIPLIARLHKTWPFTLAIVQKALNDIETYGDLPKGFKINFNFFPQDIESGAILELLVPSLLQRHNLRFVIEVTEHEKLTSEAAGQALKLLSEQGFEIAIDDFGTGYSNLRQIQEYQCHTLKIDRSFVSEMEAGAIRSTLIPHIVDIARKIDAQVVAEGIENNMQNQELISAGVVFGQGYMFGKPMPLDKLVAMLPKT